MKKNELRRLVEGNKKMETVVEHWESHHSGKRGAENSREKFYAKIKALNLSWLHLHHKLEPSLTRPFVDGSESAQQFLARVKASRLKVWKRQKALELAKKAAAYFDEHGYFRGDYLKTEGYDYVAPWESSKAPYHDSGNTGLGLITITRTRNYAKSCCWRPSSVSTHYLVGRNEAGTYFSHPVPQSCWTVSDAVQWIWNGKANQIIQRQGDIALITGNGGPKMPRYLPDNHEVYDDIVIHPTHPDLPLPKRPGERIIIGRRVAERASEATRD